MADVQLNIFDLPCDNFYFEEQPKSETVQPSTPKVVSFPSVHKHIKIENNKHGFAKATIQSNVRIGNKEHTQQKVLPIKNPDIVNQTFNALLKSGRHGLRNACIFALNVAIGRRSSDILNLKIKDIYDFSTHTIRIKTSIRESKTGKSAQDMPINNSTRTILLKYIRSLNYLAPDAFLFPSQKKDANGNQRPLNVSSLDNIYKDNTEHIFADIEEGQVGKHTHITSYEARKTYGYSLYRYYKENHNGMTEFGVDIVEYLQSLYNHSSKLITLRYIGVYDELSLDSANQIASQYDLKI